MTPTERRPPGRLAWPVPAALGVIGGILLGLGAGWGALVLGLGGALGLLDRRAWLTVLTGLAALAGFASLSAVQRQPDVLVPWMGAQVTLQGRWDGQFLTLREPRARVALAPKPAARPGPLTVSGRLVHPEGRRIPGGFDQAAWLRGQGGLLVPTPSAVLVAARVRESAREGGVRGWFRTGVTAGLNTRQAALMQAIQLGDRNEIGQEDFQEGYAVRDAFSRAGLAHLMALSGQNVALITGLLLFLLGWTPLPTPWRYALTAAALLGFLWLVGPSPSITRAVLMGFAVLAGLMLGRGKPDPLAVIALAALACLLAFPLWLLDVGFQLSFLAVLGLTQTARVADRLPARWPHALRLGIAATVLAELATLPVIAHTFGQLPLVGLPANLLAGTVMAALVPLGFLAGLLGPLAAPLNLVNGLLAGALLAVAETFGRAPVLTWGLISSAGFAAYYTVLGVGLLWLLGRLRTPALLAAALACMALTFLPARLHPPRELVYLDVGQGDATLVRLPHLTVLIDAGGSVGSDYDVGGHTVLPALRALGVRKLDVVVATHADTDHIEGLSSVLRGLPVGELWIGQRKTDDPVLTAVLVAARDQGVRVREVRRGDQITADGVALTVLWPEGRVWSTEDNENSVALRLDTGHWHAAFLGDLPSATEGILGTGPLNLLKAAHHGSRHSTGDALLAQATPRDAVISVGRNTYGHPHLDVLNRLQSAGTKVWRTDQVGTIRWPIP